MKRLLLVMGPVAGSQLDFRSSLDRANREFTISG